MSRVAVIGSGISGLAAAHLLSQKHEVTLFEKEDRLGGHTHTHTIETSCGPLPIDTGFIVHNDRTYPNLVRLFRSFGLERVPSDMSFGVSCRETGFDYSSRGLSGFFGSWPGLLRFRQVRMLREMIRFNRESRELLKHPENANITLGEYLRANQFDGDFARYYLQPMAAAVWSTSLEEIEQFPAFTLIRFFDNHGFLGLNTHAQWQVLKGGSNSYISHLTTGYQKRIRLDAKITGVTRPSGSVIISFANAASQAFDEVVFACHAPQALAMLSDATPVERQVLGNFRTSRNETVLHTDATLLPRRPAARASWNYHLDGSSKATLTYHMNRLQRLPVKEDYCVTLNPADSPRRDRVLREMTYYHPLYTLDAIQSQARWSEVSGPHRTHFCGAYWFYGFHEDGLNSAIRVAESLGVRWLAA